MLQLQRINLLIDLAGLEARTKQMESVLSKGNEDQADDLIQPLRRIVQLQTANLEAVVSRREKGIAGRSTRNEAERRLLEAKIKLAEVESRSLSSSPLKDARLQVEMERAEKTARLEKTELVLKELAPARNLFHANRPDIKKYNDRLGHFTEKLKQAEEDLLDARLELKNTAEAEDESSE